MGRARLLLCVFFPLTRRVFAYTEPCPNRCDDKPSESTLPRIASLVEGPNCMCDYNTHILRPDLEYLAAHACVDDIACNLEETIVAFASLPSASPAGKHRWVTGATCGSPCTSGSCR